jgi:AMMECR1 domain-containing protein
MKTDSRNSHVLNIYILFRHTFSICRRSRLHSCNQLIGHLRTEKLKSTARQKCENMIYSVIPMIIDSLYRKFDSNMSIFVAMAHILKTLFLRGRIGLLRAYSGF